MIVEPIFDVREQFFLAGRFLRLFLVHANIGFTGSQNRIVPVRRAAVHTFTVRRIENHILLALLDDGNAFVLRFLFLHISARIKFRQRVVCHDLVENRIKVLRVILFQNEFVNLIVYALRNALNNSVQESIPVRNFYIVQLVIVDVPDNAFLQTSGEHITRTLQEMTVRQSRDKLQQIDGLVFYDIRHAAENYF